MGILFALIALLSWGVGDFLIQRSTRRLGDLNALLCITLFAGIVLFPFIAHDIPALFTTAHRGLFILLLASTILLFVSVINFEALRIGKISVIEPIYALEVPITATLAASVIREFLTTQQTLLIFSLMVGLILVSIRSFTHMKRIHLEKGVAYAVLATVGMGVVNFFFGWGSRETSPLLINWFTSSFIAVLVLLYFLFTGRMKNFAQSFRTNKGLILGVSVIDNLAWVSYSYSTLFIPIAIATGLTESYIVLAAALGFLINKEKLNTHQLIGFVIAIVSAVVLAFVTRG